MAVALASAMVLIVDTTTATKVMEAVISEVVKDVTITKVTSISKDLIHDPIEEIMLVMVLTSLAATTTVADNLNEEHQEVRLEVEPEMPRMRIATPLPTRTNRR